MFLNTLKQIRFLSLLNKKLLIYVIIAIVLKKKKNLIFNFDQLKNIYFEIYLFTDDKPPHLPNML